MIKKILITVVVLGLSGWLVTWGRDQYIYQKTDNFFEIQDERLISKFPGVAYTHAMVAYGNGANDEAIDCLSRAVVADVAYMDAWLRMAEIYAYKGDAETAKNILRFSHQRPMQVLNWNWYRMPLAWELGLEEVFFSDANMLIAHGQTRQDTFQILDLNLKGDTERMLSALDETYWVDYFNWLRRWNRIEDSGKVWDRLSAEIHSDEKLILAYINFLLKNKEIVEAASIWEAHSGFDGITNGGFETDATHKGFDWRYSHSKPGKWRIQRIGSPIYAGRYSLQIRFTGKENIAFRNLHQIFPIKPGVTHRLDFAWKSKNITTDQGPFAEVYGYGCKGLYEKTPMMLKTHDWKIDTITFMAPDDCKAAMVRLRRNPSKRFDNLISGTLWLDDFVLSRANQYQGAEREQR